jgi:multiple RNA-binding domain-containing protein 1
LLHSKPKVQIEESVNPNGSKWTEQEDSLKNEESIAESGRIFIRNLAYTATEEELEQLFSKYGRKK